MRSLLLLAVALASSGCCTQAGCLSGYVISLSGADALPEGLYDLEVIEDDIPEIPCNLEIASGEDACGFDGGCILALSCPFDLSASQDAEHVDVRVDDQFPSEIEARLYDALSGVVLAEGSWELVYDTHRPNGPRCGPRCELARVTLDIP